MKQPRMNRDIKLENTDLQTLARFRDPPLLCMFYPSGFAPTHPDKFNP